MNIDKPENEVKVIARNAALKIFDEIREIEPIPQNGIIASIIASCLIASSFIAAFTKDKNQEYIDDVVEKFRKDLTFFIKEGNK